MNTASANGREKRIPVRFRLTPEKRAAFKLYCAKLGKSMGEVIDDYVAALPDSSFSKCADGVPQERVNRFWSLVKKTGEDDGCWEWQASRSGFGHGQFFIQGRGVIGAHRFAYELSNGPIPDGLHCRHRCDNPPCCNPRHLFIGTALDNILDCVNKGRNARGESSGNSKLTEAEVAAIRKAYATGRWTQAQIAEHVGVSPSTVSQIVRREGWRHVE